VGGSKNSGKPLSRKKLDQMRADWCVEPNIQKIARTHKVSRITVKKYRDAEDWLSFKAKIDAKTAELAAQKQAEKNVDDLDIVDGYITKQAIALEHESATDFSITGFDRAVRLKRLILGLDDGQGGGGKIESVDEVIKAIGNLTTGEIRELEERLSGGENTSG